MSLNSNTYPSVPCMWIENNPRGKVDLCSADPKRPVIQECDDFEQANKIMAEIIFGERVL